MQTRLSSLSSKQSRLVILSILLFDRSRCVRCMRFFNPDISVIWLALNSVKSILQVGTNVTVHLVVYPFKDTGYFEGSEAFMMAETP